MMYGLLAVVLMAMDQRGHYVPRVRSAAAYLVEPVYHVVEWPVRALRNLFGQFQSRRSLRHENDRLRALLLQQDGDLQRLATLVEENTRLRSLFEGAQAQEFEYRFAELLQVDLDPFSHRVLIDRGSSDGVVEGQAVIDGSGVMGQVEDVHLHYSSVRLISDPNHALPVQINRTGLRTVAFGTGETGYLFLPSVPREADVRLGDLIVTSGLGERFPGGYPVARVADINREEGLRFAQVRALPTAALDRSREVLLISTVRQQMMEAETGDASSLPGENPQGQGAQSPTAESPAESPDETEPPPQ